MIDPTLLTILIILVLNTVITSATFIFLYVKLMNFMKQEQLREHEHLEAEFQSLISNQLEQRLASILPSAKSLEKTIASHLDDQIQTLSKALDQQVTQTAQAQIKTLQHNISDTFRQTDTQLQQTKAEYETQLKQQLHDYYQEKIDQIDAQIQAQVTQAVGDVLQAEISVDQHAQIIKKQLKAAQKFYATD